MGIPGTASQGEGREHRNLTKAIAFIGPSFFLEYFKYKNWNVSIDTKDTTCFNFSQSIGKKILYDILAFAKESVNSHVTTLGPQNFPASDKEPWLVDFFAPVSYFYLSSFQKPFS